MFTDKLVAKIPSTATGVVKEINFKNDTICAVGHPIMTIETDEDALPEKNTSTPAQQEDTSSSSSDSSDSSDSDFESIIDKTKDNVSIFFVALLCMIFRNIQHLL